MMIGMEDTGHYHFALLKEILSNLNGGKITTAIIKSIIVTIKEIKNKVLFNLDSFIKSRII